VKQLKNRYSDPSKYKRFVLGVDRSKMKLYDVEQDAQSGLADAGHNPTQRPQQNGNGNFKKKDFGGFKV
jgi:hypothetical protein